MSAEKKMMKEKESIRLMIEDYCSNKHGFAEGALCEECNGLLEYAYVRIDKCPFGENKTNCGDCKVHCYKPEMRGRVIDVMRFSGPRMAFKHPILAAQHMARALKHKNK